jgi:hypothetical protein
LAAPPGPWLDLSVTIRSDLLRAVLGAWTWSNVAATAKAVVRYVSTHTGLPALLVAAVLLCVGYRVLKRTARFSFEVMAVALALAAATRLGWIRW